MIDLLIFVLVMALMLLLAKLFTKWTLKYLETVDDDSKMNAICYQDPKKLALNDMADEFNYNYLCYDNYFKEESL
jgi:hypothetical protein